MLPFLSSIVALFYMTLDRDAKNLRIVSFNVDFIF